MTRTGLALGKNRGHVTEQRELAPKPSHRKGVRILLSTCISSNV